MGGVLEIAKEALGEAIRAIQAIAEVKAIVTQVQMAANQHEQRVTARLAEIETRLRELERELSKLGGTVSGGYAEAVKILLLEQHRAIGVGIASTRSDKGSEATKSALASVPGGKDSSADE